jgi:hypothetical protein
LIAGSAVAPTAFIIPSICSRWLAKNRSKLSRSGHSSITMICPSLP